MTYKGDNVMVCSAIACDVVTHNAMNTTAHDSESDTAHDASTVER
jgi:hypothetical protein